MKETIIEAVKMYFEPLTRLWRFVLGGSPVNCYNCGKPFTDHKYNKDWRCPDGKDCWSPYGEPGF